VCQKILEDINFKTGKKNDWRADKLKTLQLGESYKRLGMKKKAKRVCECSDFLEFAVNPDTGEKKLSRMNSCHVRLCTMCGKRRSKKIYAQVSKVMDQIADDYAYLFLTLTAKNCEGENLKDMLDLMFKAYNKMFQRAKIKQAVKGWFRAIEITHNLDLNSPSYDTYHPHFHVILAIPKSYFTSRDYIKQAEWTQFWKDSLQVEYDPIVDVRRFKATNEKELSKSLAESAKYTVKDNDYLVDDEEMTDKTVKILDEVLAHRRLVAFGGKLKEVHKQLQLDDEVDGDLVKTGLEEDELRKDVQYMIEIYQWHVGYQNYFYWGSEFKA
jgi:plasmid rolling circle replication initiator protein Rep